MPLFGKKISRKKRLLVVTLLFCIVFMIPAWYFLGKWAKGHGFEGAGDFIKTVSANYWSSFDAKYETIEITIDQNDFDKLNAQRDLHLKNQIITKLDDRFVPAIITYNGKKIKSKIRLKGHMTDHLQENKWSFRVKTVNGDAFMGMRVFSLMHPGTRNYIYEWIYHELLKHEDIPTVRYNFINVKLNGESWGIFAVEEHFADELISNSKLPKGPILGFNPDLYWYARIQEKQKASVNQEAIGFVSTYAEAYDEDEQFKDEESKNNYARAILKFRKFLSGEVTVSQTFDINKLARFHAVLDLVGGQFSLDWSDVKYYYNPVTQLLEPVGYESFSVRETRQLCGSFKFKNNFNLRNSWHEMLFSDSEFYSNYISELKRISKPEYLNQFFDKIDSDLKNNLNVLYTEFPYKKLSLGGYYKNQDQINRLLTAPVTSALYLEEVKKDTLYFSVTTTSQFPYQLNSIISDGKEHRLENPIILSSRKSNEPVFYESFNIPFKLDSAFSENKLEFKFSIPGKTKNTETIVKVKNTNPVTVEDNTKLRTQLKSNIQDFSFLDVDETNKTILIRSGKYQLNQTIYIPENYKVVAESPLEIDFINNSEIVSKSPLFISGSLDNPVLLFSSDSSGVSIFLNSVKEVSKFKFVEIFDYSNQKGDKSRSVISAYESKCIVSDLKLSANHKTLIYSVNSEITIKESRFEGSEKGISSLYSDVKLSGLHFTNVENPIRDIGSRISVAEISITKSKKAIVLKNGSNFNGNEITIKDSKEGIIAEDLSKVIASNLNLESVDVGLIAEKKSDVFGPSTITVKKMKVKNVQTNFKKDKKSEVNIKW